MLYKFSYKKIEITMHTQAKSIQKMWNRKHEQASNRFPHACFSWWVAIGCSATFISIGSLVTLDITIKAQKCKSAAYLTTPMLNRDSTIGYNITSVPNNSNVETSVLLITPKNKRLPILIFLPLTR